MSTNKKKIEKRWKITRWDFDPATRQVITTCVGRTKPMTERRARSLIKNETLGASACWKIEAYK